MSIQVSGLSVMEFLVSHEKGFSYPQLAPRLEVLSWCWSCLRLRKQWWVFQSGLDQALGWGYRIQGSPQILMLYLGQWIGQALALTLGSPHPAPQHDFWCRRFSENLRLLWLLLSRCLSHLFDVGCHQGDQSHWGCSWNNMELQLTTKNPNLIQSCGLHIHLSLPWVAANWARFFLPTEAKTLQKKPDWAKILT